MGLRESLIEHLPSVLPKDPKDAKTGTQLISELSRHISTVYGDASYRWQFSTMSRDPSSVIAKVAGAQGYYLRPPPLARQEPEPGNGDAPETPPPNDPNSPDSQGSARGSRGDTPEEKFRSLYMHWCRIQATFPVHIEHTSALRRPAGLNKWKFPDVVVLEWLVGDDSEGRFVLDRTLLEVRRSLGEQPFRLSSVELKVSAETSMFREHFFQCLSNSKWAHTAELAFALPLDDATLRSELRRLGVSYGVSVTSFGIPAATLAALPHAGEIDGWTVEVADKWFAANSRLDTVHEAADRAAIDWDQFEDLRHGLPVASTVVAWIAHCLREGRALAFEAFQELRDWQTRHEQ